MNVRVGLDVLEKRKFSYSSGIRTLDRPARTFVSVSSELSRYLSVSKYSPEICCFNYKWNIFGFSHEYVR